MDVKCRKTTCIHNQNYNCNAKKVEISHQSVCDTYCKGNGGEDKSKNMFETASEYGSSQHIRDKDLTCHCKNCLFNQNKRCAANGITVIDDGSEGACATFIYDE